jgi:hypothetical protein
MHELVSDMPPERIGEQQRRARRVRRAREGVEGRKKRWQSRAGRLRRT